MVNLSSSSGRPSFAMSAIFTIHVLAQYALSRSREEYLVGVHVLPKLTAEQAESLGIAVAGLYKTKACRYQKW